MSNGSDPLRVRPVRVLWETSRTSAHYGWSADRDARNRPSATPEPEPVARSARIVPTIGLALKPCPLHAEPTTTDPTRSRT